MSFFGLLNKRCSWKRRIIKDRDSYGEIIYSDIIKGSDVRCARQVGRGLNVRQEFVGKDIGNTTSVISRYWLFPTDIQEGDVIKFEGSELETVRNVRDAAGVGHHLEVMARQIMPQGEEDKRQ